MSVDPLQGLRGFAALHIMFGHFMMRCVVKGNWMPQMEMPIFYLLSGYGLALGYGSKPALNLRAYFQNRFAAIFPLYWLSNLMQYKLLWTKPEIVKRGYNRNLVALAIFTATNSWFFIIDPMYPYPINGVTWTVTTLNFFYLVFPIFLPLFKKLSDVNISRCLVLLFFIQLAPSWTRWHSRIVTLSPFTRLPVFLMGMLGGIQTLRWQSADTFQDPNESYPIVHDIIPWGLGIFTRSSHASTRFDKQRSKRIWGYRADFCAIALLLYCYGLARGVVQKFVLGNILLFPCHMMTTIVIALNRSKSDSFVGKIFSTFFFQRLGDLSYSIYLVHMLDVVKDIQYHLIGNRKLLLQEIMQLMTVVIAISYLVHVHIEKPLKDLLRYKAKKQTGIIST